MLATDEDSPIQKALKKRALHIGGMRGLGIVLLCLDGYLAALHLLVIGFLLIGFGVGLFAAGVLMWEDTLRELKLMDENP